MESQNLKKRLKQEVESEASALERRVSTKKELESLEMPEDSYERLMEQISIKEKERSRIHLRNSRRRAIVTAAVVMLVVAVGGLGVNGARLYVLSVENRERGGKPEIAIDTENAYYGEIGEDEAYEKIEEEIGILALRIGDKPEGMELGKVCIDAEMCEALMEFYYQGHVLSIYENKQTEDASFNAQIDGKKIETIDVFYLDQEAEIIEVDKDIDEVFYRTQIKFGNAYYLLSTDMELEEFESILYGIIFRNK